MTGIAMVLDREIITVFSFSNLIIHIPNLQRRPENKKTQDNNKKAQSVHME